MSTYFGEYAVISSLQNQFKTDNIIFDMIVGLFVAKIIQSMFNYSLFDFVHIFQKIKNKDFFNKGKVEIVCSAQSEDKKFTILQTIDNIIKKDKIKTNNIYYDNNGKDFILRGLDKTLLSDNIYVTINSEDIDRKKDEFVVTRMTIYTITFTSHIHNSIEIEKKLDEYIKLWEKDSYKKPQQITRNTYCPKNFKSFKTFDNLFFDGKEDLIKTLNRFKNNEAFYKKLGRPYTLGILLYGEPGCGKTSVLKAIANYLNLDIHSINIKNYDDIDTFMDCWYRSLKTDSWNANSLTEKIIHLPEVDYLCDEFLKDEEQEKMKKSERESDSEKNIVINVNKSDDDEENKKKKNTLTKSFFRELFDGVDEHHGRIIVMDSNNPERLDPIMIRDGRIDVKLHFDKMSSDNMKLYLEHVYDIKLEKDINLPHRKFRVAKIQSIVEICISNDISVYECINKINNLNIEEVDKL